MQQFNSSNSKFTTHISAANVAAGSLLVVCFTLGVPGNIAVIVRLAGRLKSNNYTQRLMLNLAISDLLTLLLSPVWTWSLLNSWTFGLVLCKCLAYVLYWTIYCTILCVILLSVQRYMQVLHPVKWAKVGGKGQKILLCGTWMLSGVLSTYSLVQFSVQDKDGQLQCDAKYRNDTERVATLVWETLTFVMAFSILAYFYLHLYQGVNRSAFLKSHKVAKLLTRIVVAFFVFWIPYNITKLLIIIALLLKNDSLLRYTEALGDLTRALTFINSCVNPLLYVFSVRASQQPAADEND